MLRITKTAGVLEPTDGQLAELRLGQPEVAVEIVELLLETLEPIQVLLR